MKIEQIKKALECCEDSEKCDVCPYYGSIHCQEILIKDALGFINRQQAEIERLKTENGHFERNMKSVLEIEKENIRKETAKEFADDIISQLWNRGRDKDGKMFDYGDLTSKEVWRIAKYYGVEVEE